MANEVTPIRNPKGQFVKGRSGNPSGRATYFTDAVGNRIALQQLYLDNAGVVFSKLLQLITAKDTPATARVSAIKEYNDRALGKAPNSLVVKQEASDEADFDIKQLPTKTLHEIINLRRGQPINDEADFDLKQLPTKTLHEIVNLRPGQPINDEDE